MGLDYLCGVHSEIFELLSDASLCSQSLPEKRVLTAGVRSPLFSNWVFVTEYENMGYEGKIFRAR